MASDADETVFADERVDVPGGLASMLLRVWGFQLKKVFDSV